MSTTICDRCNDWFSRTLYRLFIAPNHQQIAAQEVSDPSPDINTTTHIIRSLKYIDDIYRWRKTCWVCSRIWMMHRFDILGAIQYYSDEDIRSHFESASIDGKVEIILEYHPSTSLQQLPNSSGDLVLSSGSGFFFRLRFSVERSGKGRTETQPCIQYSLVEHNARWSLLHSTHSVSYSASSCVSPSISNEASRLEHLPEYIIYDQEEIIVSRADLKSTVGMTSEAEKPTSSLPTLRRISSADIADKTRSIIAEECGIHESDVHDDNLLSELGVDSLLTYQIAQRIGDAFGIHLNLILINSARDLATMRSSIELALRLSEKHESGENAFLTELQQIKRGLDMKGSAVQRYRISSAPMTPPPDNTYDLPGNQETLQHKTARRSREPSREGNIAALSPSRVSRVTDWLRICDNEHCCQDVIINPSESEEVLPTRLIEVLEGSSVKLVETSSLSDRLLVKYATLSHCWGDERSDMLLVSNYASRLEGIMLSSLNKTNSEAIWLCRMLGIKYIWIDSLCIVQDAREQRDWIHEAPRMDQVYGRSYLNIAATMARSGKDGIIHEPAGALLEGLEIKVSDSVYLRDIDRSTQKIFRVFRESPLTLRGWVQQELLLNPRTLHLTDEQMIWICRNGMETEITQDCSTARFASYWRSHIQHPLEERDLTSLGSLDSTWLDVARYYSPSRVTFGDDRYTALSGIARLFQRRYKAIGTETYLIAGCWYHNLVRQMLWLSKITTYRSSYGQTFLPSWSWLSAEGKGLLFIEDDGVSKPCTELLKVDMVSQNPKLAFGPLTEATVTLRGPVLFMKASPLFNWKYSPTTTAPNGTNLSSQMQGRVEVLSNGQHTTVTQHDMEPNQNYCHFERVPNSPWDSNFKCLLMLAGNEGTFAVHHALILDQTGHDADGRETYQRVGSLSIYDFSSAEVKDYKDSSTAPLQTLLAPGSLAIEDIKLV